MSSIMFNIKYIPNVNVRKLSNSHIIEILWNKSESVGGQEQVSVSKETIYIDVEQARNKISAIKSIWGTSGGDRITIIVATELLKEDEGVISHVLFETLSELIPDMYMNTVKLEVTHKGVHNDKVANIISVIRKIFAARMIGMMPANVATPEYMAKLYARMFRTIKNTRVDVFNHKDLEKRGFGLLLGVGNSAKVKPTCIIVERKGSGSGGPCIALVGKGVTFDSGGLTLKSVRGMTDMKYDKLGATYACAILLHLLEDSRFKHVSFIGAFPFAENAVSDNSLRPGDVIKSYSGKTVEVLNPDAEGRLIMADAFSYVGAKYKPDFLIDLATLTGHAALINCWHNAYFYSSSPIIRSNVEEIGNKYGERMLAMPTWTEYSDVLRSNVADLVNSPLSCSDAFVAALFLKEFVPKSAEWLHMDLAHEVNMEMIPSGYSIRTVIGVIEEFIKSFRNRKSKK